MSDPMMKKFPLGRTIALAIGCLFLAGAAWLLVQGHYMWQKVDRWRTARPIDMAVDLSRPGEFSGDFEHTYNFAHCAYVDLEVPPEVLADIASKDLLAGLALTCKITNSQGRVVAEESFDGASSDESTIYKGRIPVAYLPSVAEGKYTLTLEVTTGADRLAGVRQRLVGWYMLCGCEMIPAVVTTIAGLVALVVGGLILLIVGIITWRKRKKGEESPQQ